MLFIYIDYEHLLGNEERGLSVSGVAEVETTARFDDFIVEVVRHLWLGITVHEPHQIDAVILGAIGCVLFTTQKSRDRQKNLII